MYPSLQKSQSMRSKRKSAVELLAESKAFYVKSETVRDSQQALPLRLGTASVHAPASSAGVRGKSGGGLAMLQGVPPPSAWRPVSMPVQCKWGACCAASGLRQSHSPSDGRAGLIVTVPCVADMAVSPSRSLPPLRLTGRRSTSACSDVLQNKLRKLLNGDSRENVSGGGPTCISPGLGFSACDERDRLIDDFIPISPPAEYAITERSSYRYAASCSPEQRVVHKSLPDLHNNSCDGTGQHRSTGTGTGTGTGSNKSTSNKSLSNRDSGESSGHYTHRSEPAPAPVAFLSGGGPGPGQGPCAGCELRPEARRDSGSSTQHSGASAYGVMDGGGSSMPPPSYGSRTTRQGYPPPQPPPGQEERYRVPPYDYSGMPYQDPTLSPGPGTFKRQKCFRYKQRDRSSDSRPILRSKSDISDRYWRCGTLPPQRKAGAGAPGDRDRGGGIGEAPAVSHLEQFFEQLGLNSDSYESMLLENGCDSSSPVYFSDVSTVDSSRPIDNSDYCSPAPFRPSEPPSIVERNARIIKWLCNCRKLQITNS